MNENVPFVFSFFLSLSWTRVNRARRNSDRLALSRWHFAPRECDDSMVCIKYSKVNSKYFTKCLVRVALINFHARHSRRTPANLGIRGNVMQVCL